MDKKLILFVLLTLSLSIVHGEYYEYRPDLPQLGGFVDVNMSDKYYAGQILNANLKVVYSDKYYLPDAKLVVEIIRAYDNSSIYPADKANHNVIYEKVYDLYLNPGDIININFNYSIPEDIEEGNYYLVTYLYTPLSYISGLPFIFLPGEYKQFYIENKNKGDYPYVIIDRSFTTVNSLTGQYGASTTDTLSLNIALRSKINTTARVVVYYSEWDDITRNKTKIYDNYVNLTEGLNDVSFSVNVGNLQPSAYAVRIEVYVNDTLQSLYRLRFIKLGPTAKIRGVLLDDNGNLILIVGPSPDHFTYPTTKDVILNLYSPQLNINKNYTIGDISYYTTGFVYIKDGINITVNEFTLCAEAYSQNILTDKYCAAFKIRPKTYTYLDYKDGVLILNTSIGGELYIENINQSKLDSYSLQPGYYEYNIDPSYYYKVKFQREDGAVFDLQIFPKVSPTTQNITQQEQNISQNISQKSKEISKGKFDLLPIVLALIILIAILLFMKKRGMFVILIFFSLILSPVFSSSPQISLGNNVLCSINGTLSVNTYYNDTPYDVRVKIYVGNDNYSYSYKCTDSSCFKDIKVDYLYPSSYTVQVDIIKNNSVKYSEIFNILSTYPYSFTLYSDSISQGSSDAVIINNVTQCQNLNGYTSTLFNFSIYDSANKTILATKTNCNYWGEPVWGPNICGIPTESLSVGNYSVFVNYSIGGYTFSQYIDLLQVVAISLYGFTSKKCSHAWSAQSQGGGVGYLFNYKIINGKYTTDPSGNLIISNGSTFQITDIKSLNYLCSDSHYADRIALLFGFVYRSLNNAFNTNYNTSKFIFAKDNDGNSFGEEVGNVLNNIYYRHYKEGFIANIGSGGGGTTSSFDVYNFRYPDYFTIFVNQVNSVCDSPSNYICPVNSGTDNLCNIGAYGSNSIYYVGWIDRKVFPILVAYPNASGTYVGNLKGYFYYDDSSKKWYVYIHTYNLYSVNNEQTLYSIPKYVPLDSFLVSNIHNIGKGNITIEASTDKGQSKTLNISQGSYSYVTLNLSNLLNTCLYRKCDFTYSIKYSDAYGFYNATNFTDGPQSIILDWVHINVKPYLKESNIYYNQISYLLINVTNLDPAPAENITILSYSAGACVNIKMPTPIYVDGHSSKLLYIPILINNVDCSPEDYYLNLTIGGINTYNVSINVMIPVSKIISPQQGLSVSQGTIFKIRDVNANRCYVEVIDGGNEYNISRLCNSDFTLNVGCSSDQCIINAISENDYGRFIFPGVYSKSPNIVNGVLSYTKDKYVIVNVGDYANATITLVNMIQNELTCKFEALPGVYFGNAEVSKWYVNNQPNVLTFNILPGESKVIKITYHGVNKGMDYGSINIYCSDSYGNYANINDNTTIYVLQGGKALSESEIGVIIDERINLMLLAAIAILFIMMI